MKWIKWGAVIGLIVTTAYTGYSLNHYGKFSLAYQEPFLPLFLVVGYLVIAMVARKRLP